jgi:hypothetical protein
LVQSQLRGEPIRVPEPIRPMSAAFTAGLVLGALAVRALPWLACAAYAALRRRGMRRRHRETRR